MTITLKKYDESKKTETVQEIIEFWKFHHALIRVEDAVENISEWTNEQHLLYLIFNNEIQVGFLHIGTRANLPEWIEDIYVKPEYRKQGFASQAIKLAEQIIFNNGSSSIFIEVAAFNQPAIQLYHQLGYQRLSSITIRKDLNQNYLTKEEQLWDKTFKIRLD